MCCSFVNRKYDTVFIDWVHTLPWISEDRQWLKWNLMTNGPIRSSGQPGKTELRVWEILESWPNISEVSNKERDWEADGGFKNGLQIHIFGQKKKKKKKKPNTKQILSIISSSLFSFTLSVRRRCYVVMCLPPSSPLDSSPLKCSSCNSRTSKGSSLAFKHSSLPKSTTQDRFTHLLDSKLVLGHNRWKTYYFTHYYYLLFYFTILFYKLVISCIQ